MARLGYVTRARITQIMNLSDLAPNIQEEVLHLAGSVQKRTLAEKENHRSRTSFHGLPKGKPGSLQETTA